MNAPQKPPMVYNNAHFTVKHYDWDVFAGPSAGEPYVDAALTDRIGRALAAFGRTRIERDFALDAEAAAYGIASPEMVILVYGPERAQPLAQYTIGDLAPDTFSRYVQAAGRDEVVTIANYQITNLLDLIAAVTGQSDP